MSPDGTVVHDVCVAVVTSGVAVSLLRFWEELAKRGVFEQKLNRKLVHISIGMVFLLFWPLFSSGSQAPFLAALAPGINIIRMLLMGLGLWKNETMVKSISRHGDYRELLKGPLYYACTITLATSVFWRTSPIAIAAICNLCAGDGMTVTLHCIIVMLGNASRVVSQLLSLLIYLTAVGVEPPSRLVFGVADIVGRRFGRQKLPYNPNKSYAGSIAMASAGFVASIGYMHYFSLFGFVEESWGMALGFLLVSLFAAFVESLPISSELDDNLTVPLTSLFLGCLVF